VEIQSLVALTVVFFALSALAQPFAERLRLPLAAVLALLGLSVSIAAQVLSGSSAEWMSRTVQDTFLALSDPQVPSDLFLFVLLPILLFQGAVGLDLRHIAKDSAAILTMAILAVLVSIGSIGYAAHWATGLDLTICLLLGAIVATTDPSAVIAMFRSLGAPARLTHLVEGESLLNDATAIAAFTVLLGAALAETSPSLEAIATQLSLGFLMGGALGAGIGLAVAFLLGLIRRHRSAQMTLVLATPYGVFLLGSGSALVSEVVAVVVAGATVGVIGRSRFRRGEFSFLSRLLEQVSDWATGLIFLLAALLVPSLLAGVRVSDLGLVGAVVGAALLARALMLWGVAPILGFAGLMVPVTPQMNAALLWGGLRGAMTLALALSVNEMQGFDPEAKRAIVVGATGYTLFTLFVQGTTLRALIRFLGLSDLAPVDAAFRAQALSRAIEQTRERVRDFSSRAGLPASAVDKVISQYELRMREGAETSRFENDVTDIEKLRLGLGALVAHERSLLLQQRWSSGMPAYMIDQYLFWIDAMRDAARQEGRTGYLRAARAPLSPSYALRALVLLHNRLGVHGPLARHISRRFHHMLVNRTLLMQLLWHARGRLRAVFGERISDILVEILERRKEELERNMDAIRLQYPGFASSLEISLIERYAHQEELAQIHDLEQLGVITPEIARSLADDVDGVHKLLSQPTDVDIERPKPELLKCLRPFENFTDAQLKRASRALSSVVYSQNQKVYKPGDNVDYIYFIASGAVEVDREGDMVRLGRGQAFGQLRALNPNLKPATITTLSHSHFFRMRVRDFRKILREAPDWKASMLSDAINRTFQKDEGA